MQKQFHYSLKDKLFFYASYFFYKVILPFEVRKPKFKVWIYEWIYSLAKFRNYQSNTIWNFQETEITTRFGTFSIRPKTSDAANVSPAFERLDQRYLFTTIRTLLKRKKRIIFCDIGADLGTYSVIVGNKFKHENVFIHSFEPVAESCKLLHKNLQLNGCVEKVTVHNCGLFHTPQSDASIRHNTLTPGSSTLDTATNGIETKITLDTLDRVLLPFVSKQDILVLKIDVEGAEQSVLEGGHNVLSLCLETYCMVEDFIKPSIIEYLQKNGWNFCAKLTSYNSWWRKGGPSEGSHQKTR